MWANAQRDGRPAKYRWRPLFNVAVWLTPTTGVPCSNAAKTWNALKFAGVHQTGKPISAASGPKFTILSGHVEEVLLFNKFFLIVDTCLSCADIARQICAMVPWWRFFLRPVFSASRVQHVSDCILNSYWGHTMCGSMVDIQSVTAEIRRGKKRRKNKRHDENTYGLAY